MAGNLGEAVLDLTADKQPLMDDIEKAKPGILSALDGLGFIGGQILAAGFAIAATAIVGITSMIWDAGNTLDAAYDTIMQRTGATGAELEQLRDDFDAVFASVPASAGDAADAISIVNQRLGLTGFALQESAAALLEMTRITGGDLLTNGEALTRVIGDWGIANSDVAGTLDAVFVASQQSGAGVDRLMQMVVQFGAPMRQFGFSFEESIALLGKWEKEGVNTELVMGSLRIAAGEFARENIPLKEGLQDTFEAIKAAKDESTALEIAMEVFGARAGPDMAAAIRENRFELGDLVAALEGADGAIMKTAEETMDWGERWTLFKNRMTAALGPAGMGLMDSVGRVLGSIEQIASRSDVQAGLMRIVNGIASLAQKGAEYLPVLINHFFRFVQFLQNNQDVVVVILAVIGAAIAAFAYTTVIPAALAVLSALAPILLLMAAVAAIAWVVYQAWTNNWGGIRDAVMQFWVTVQPYFQMLVQWLQTNIPLAIQGLSNFWQSVLMPVLQAFFGFLADVVLPALSNLVTWLGTNIPIAVASVQEKLIALQARFVKFVDSAKEIVKFVSEKIVGAFQAAAKVIGSVISMIQGLIKKFQELAEKVPDIFTPGSPTPFETGMWGIHDALRAVANTALPALGGSFDANLAFAPATLAAGSLPTAGGGAGGANQYTFNMLSTELDEDQLIRALQRAEMLYG